MADNAPPRDLGSLITQFRTSDNWAVSFARDILWVIGVVGSIALALYLLCGTWPAVVTIESKSMDPNMKVGDLVLVVQKDRYGEFQTWVDGRTEGDLKFGSYGDVIIYKPNGLSSVHPIIHRAVAYATDEPITEIRGVKLKTNYTAPHPGYITWGDNNPYPDQFVSFTGIGQPEPVKEEWIVGKALFTVPLVGYLPLHIVEVVIVVIVIMVLHEMYLRSREEKGQKPAKKAGKKQK
jgi:signal peptidase